MRAFACLLLLAGCGSSTANTKPADDSAALLQTQTFQVPAGGEVFACQDFANPFHGASTSTRRRSSRT